MGQAMIAIAPKAPHHICAPTDVMRVCTRHVRTHPVNTGVAGSLPNLPVCLLSVEQAAAPLLLAGARRSALKRTNQARLLLLM